MQSHDPANLENVDETEVKPTSATRSPTVISSVKVMGTDVQVQGMSSGEIALLIPTMHVNERIFRIYDSANLSESKVEHKLPSDITALTICPNGDFTANKREWVFTSDSDREQEITRVVVDPYTLNTKKIENSVFCQDQNFYRAYSINESQYINSGNTDLTAIKIRDTKTHECKTTINVVPADSKFEQPVAWLHSATILHNKKIALTLTSGQVILFKYSDGNVSDLKWLFNPKDIVASYVFPVSEECFLTIVINKVGAFLQNWNLNTGVPIGETLELPKIFCKRVPQLLPDGSILGYGEISKICVFNIKELKPYYEDLGCHIQEVVLLANERVLVVPFGELRKDHNMDFNIRVMELNYLSKIKQTYMTREILKATQSFHSDTANIVAEYVGCDINFSKRLGLFSLPKTPEDNIRDLIKSFRPTVVELLKFFADDDIKCLELAVNLRKEVDKFSINIEKFEKALSDFRERFDVIKMQLDDADSLKFDKQFVIIQAGIEELKEKAKEETQRLLI